MKKHQQSPVFNRFLNESTKNFALGSKGNKFPRMLKEFSTLLYLQGGPSLYDMIARNASVLSLPTVKKNVSSAEDRLAVGFLDCEGLITHMEKYKTKRIIISEDATRLKAKVVYNVKSNCFVGLIAPEDPSTGLPIPDFFQIKSPSDMEKYLSKFKTAKFVQIIMAHPMELGL